MRRCFGVGLAFALGLVMMSARAEETNVVSPQSIVNDVIAHSFALQRSDRDVDVAEARWRQARAYGGPTLTLGAQAARYEGLEDSVLGPSIQIPAIPDRYGLSATILQPVFAGGSIVNRKRSADLRGKASVQIRRSAEAEAIFQALAAYWNWSKAQAFAVSLGSAVARMEAHAVDMKNQHDAGMVTDNDRLATDVLLDRTRLRMEDARRQMELARARLAFLTGHELSEGAVPETAVLPSPDAVLKEADLIEAAMTNRCELVQRQLEKESVERQAKAVAGERMPRLYLTARYEYNRPNNQFFPPVDEWNDDAFAGVAVSWDLFDSGLARARADEARAQAAQAGLLFDQTREEILLDVREALVNVQSALERAAIAVRAEKSAQRNLEVATDLWQSGLARHADVLDAQADWTDAQYQAIAARADVALSKAGLDRATGLLKREP